MFLRKCAEDADGIDMCSHRHKLTKSAALACYALGCLTSVILGISTVSAEGITALMIETAKDAEEIEKLISKVKFFRQAAFLCSVIIIQCIRFLIHSTTQEDPNFQLVLENDLSRGAMWGFVAVVAVLNFQTVGGVLEHPAIVIETLFFAMWFFSWKWQRREPKDDDDDEEDDDDDENSYGYTAFVV